MAVLHDLFHTGRVDLSLLPVYSKPLATHISMLYSKKDINGAKGAHITLEQDSYLLSNQLLMQINN